MRSSGACVLLIFGSVLWAAPTSAQSLYKYRGDDGEWIYADRPPSDGEADEVRQLAPGQSRRKVTVTSATDGGGILFTAHNPYHAPVELELIFDELRGVSLPAQGADLRFVLPHSSATRLARVEIHGNTVAPEVRYHFRYLVGDPAAVHRPPASYRVPFSIANNFTVTQAHPDLVTHTTPDSFYAVDIAMPVGTDIVAARDGIVFDVASDNYRSGLNPKIDGPSANVVRILHDDGTYAIYAHLNWNSIRVRPGDRVRRGQYIADSGNTGFSSGPHLHFAVVRNTGLKLMSVPVVFTGANNAPVMPSSGQLLTAY